MTCVFINSTNDNTLIDENYKYSKSSETSIVFLFDLNNGECFSLFVGRQVNNLVNLSVERKLYICCLLISLYNFLSGSCEVDCQGDEKYASLKDYIHLTIISLAIWEKRIWFSALEKLLWPEVGSDLSVSWLLSSLVFLGQNTVVDRCIQRVNTF